MMNKLITLDQASIRYGKNRDSFSVIASQYKKENGHHPKWYIFINKTVHIDVDEYEKLGDIERRVWNYATDNLYWIFHDIGISNWELSKMLAKKSKRFAQHTSWNTFLANNLFMPPPEIITVPKKSMRIEFVEHGTKIVYDMIKSGKLDEFRYNVSQ